MWFKNHFCYITCMTNTWKSISLGNQKREQRCPQILGNSHHIITWISAVPKGHSLLTLLRFSCPVESYSDYSPTLMTFTHNPGNQDAKEKSELGIGIRWNALQGECSIHTFKKHKMGCSSTVCFHTCSCVGQASWFSWFTFIKSTWICYQLI